MQPNRRFRRWLVAGFGVGSLLLVSLGIATVTAHEAKAGPLFQQWSHRQPVESYPEVYEDCPPSGDVGGTWYWMRSPEQEKRVVMGLYNRYCIRCHGVDGRGVWDIPDVPNFANGAWQATHSDGQLTRSIQEGRGAVMPRFHGTLTLEESWAMARYLRTFVPGTETSRPDVTPPAKPAPLPPAKTLP